MNAEYNNDRKKKKYGFLAGSLLFLSLLCAGYGGINLWSMHTFDKYVTKPIEIAANVPSVSRSRSSKQSSALSMEENLEYARAHLNDLSSQNPALVWKTPLTDVSTLDSLLEKAIERAKDIGLLQTSFESGVIEHDYPFWVRNAHSKLSVKTIISDLNPEEKKILEKLLPTLSRLAESEYGQMIGSAYESLNTAVMGGTRFQANSLKERNRSLLDTLDNAAYWRAVLRNEGADYKEAYAHVFIGYLMANMGYLREGITQFKQAKQLMDQYPDEKNLAIIRQTPALSQRTIKGLIDSSITELEALDNDLSKYSTGWWKRLRYYNQSIGGQKNPSIQDLAEEIQGKYLLRFQLSGILGLAFFFFGGRYAKRFRNANTYEVEYVEKN